MDLDTVTPNHCEDNRMKEMPMCGKHQRNLSLSAKWANDKSMAVEYLRRQRDVVTWIESVLKRELPTTDLFEALKSGVVLREMMETLFPDISNCKSPISRKYSKRMAPWKERENISVFLRQCKSIGMNDLSMFCTDDLYDGTNMVQVLFCVQHFMLFSEEHAGHLFQPVAKSQPAEFSNQELEAAMSKIEQAGVDANAFRGLISASSTTVSPVKPAIQEEDIKKSLNAVTPESSSMQSKSIEKDSRKEEPAETEGTREAEVVVEVCNQAEQDMETPADDADVNPEQESGSDADDEAEETEPEEISDPGLVSIVSEVTPVGIVAAQDGADVIQEMLSNMALVIEESVAEASRVVFATTQAALIIVSEAEARIIEITNLSKADSPAPEPLPKSEAVDEANVEIEVKEIEEPADIPVDSVPAEENVDSQPSVNTSNKVTEGVTDKVSFS
ncbi:hypothetical protein BBO99_00000546 [Phytophthora kernoviae]|uniref:Calponin-homology (CH) domain-containing protein n=1 Tax=Phytophthora kernoviae TaxID=325452 RepID=A0A3R7J9Q2_9STRA|nr:hypothetical protein JM16_000517 [Phytophthora kernoviae]KAG2533219.1 hypothetical protein JM18_000598 [Phytophthora kernoviae]RLN26040.1 hypothetical protein BBI17_000585 [Phytophthora kernoviae]RLN85419.1 hypothetical protein BBO99_00000546 [Phytophthora kernoviae]